MIIPNKTNLCIKAHEATAPKSVLDLGEDFKEQPKLADVISIGSKVEEYRVGDIILFKEYLTTPVKLDDIEYLILDEEDVLGKVEQ